MEILIDGKAVDTELGKIYLKNLSLLDIHNISFQVDSIVSYDNENYTLMEAYNYTIDNGICEPCEIAALAWTKLYAKYHGHLSIIVCVFGTIANIFNIVVLTKKEMACAPINRILTGLAVADVLLMIEYMSFAYYYHMELPEKLNFPFWGAVFMLCHTHLTQVLHTISICLTLTLAVWRYLAIGYPEKNAVLCSERRCILAIFLSYILPILLCSPTYFAFEIKSTVVEENGKVFILYHTALSMISNNDNYLVFNFWMYAVVIKLIPCLTLTVISTWLIKTLCKAKKRKQILKAYDNCPLKSGDISKGKTKAERRADRTTKMLVAVLLLFLITEFPQGIFGLLSGMKGKCFFLKCYQDFGDVMDMLALLNGSINFILYCCMNRMFRMTFGQLFRKRILANWAPSSTSAIHTTYV
ncbi:hypothetical protein Trydic_g4328 [Trypoxylus dichotomus]